MSDDTLALIRPWEIPDKGGERYARRDARKNGHLGDAAIKGFLGTVFMTGAILLDVVGLFILPPSAPFFVFVTLALGTASAGMSCKFLNGAYDEFRNYLNEKSPQFCLPAGSCPEDAEFELALREATAEYNEAAMKWNDLPDTGILPNGNLVKARLQKRRERIEQGIRFLQDGGSIKALPAPEPSREKALAHRMLGPSSLIR